MPGTKTNTLPRLGSYHEAWNFWNTAKPVARDTTVIRQLGSANQKKTFQIQQYNDRTIACRMYNTDIVTYHPNGQVAIQLWPSVSTMCAIHALFPFARPRWSEKVGGYLCSVWYDDHNPRVWVRIDGCSLTYRVPPDSSSWNTSASWDGDAYPLVDPSVVAPLWRPTAQRQKINTYRASLGWKAFKPWALARVTLGARDIPLPATAQPSPAWYVQQVKSGDPTRWEEAIRCARWTGSLRQDESRPNRVAHNLVAKIRHQCDIAGGVPRMVDWTRVPFVDDPQTAMRWWATYGAGPRR